MYLRWVSCAYALDLTEAGLRQQHLVSLSTQLLAMLLPTATVGPFFLLVLFLLIAVPLLVNYFTPGLRSIPGPFLARFSNLWRFIDACKGHHERTIVKVHQKYGPVVRIGPNVVSVADPAAIEPVLGLKANLDKTDSVRPLINTYEGEELPMLIAAIDAKRHARLRRPIAGAYSMATLLELEGVADNVISTMVRRLREKFVRGDDDCDKTCPIDQWMAFFSFDFILQATFSKDFGFLNAGKDIDGLLSMLDLQFAYIGTVGTMPWIDKLLLKNPLLLMLIKVPNRLVDFAFQKIQDRIRGGDGKGQHLERQDFLSRFMAAQSQHPEVVSNLQLMTYATTNVLAASDTTSATLAALIGLVLRHPHVLHKLQVEIDDAGLAFPVSSKEAQKLPYLDAVIKEVFRIWPVASIELERKVGPSGLVLPTGQRLPPGTTVGLNAWPLHRNADTFGSNVETFEPERWLQRSNESEEGFDTRLRLMQRASLTFGAGPRACLGKHVAYLEIYKLVPTLLGLFDVSPPLCFPPDLLNQGGGGGTC